MSPMLPYALGGAVLVALGLFVFITVPHLLRKLLAFNIMGSGVFLVVVGFGQHRGGPDPIPQALVLTGIVVAVASTALALLLLRRWHQASGRVTLDEPDQNQNQNQKRREPD